MTIIFTPFIISAQGVTSGQLVKIHNATTAQINGLTGVEEGMLVYDTDENTIYVYTSPDGWVPFQLAPNVYVGSFIISSAGAQSITGLPFKPSSITFTAHSNIEATDIDNDNGVGNNTRGLQNSFGNMTGFARDNGASITQQVIYSGGHGNSINDITRYASSSNCIGMRFSHQNGDDLGKITASLTSFDADGFTINSAYANGTLNEPNANPILNIVPTEVLGESIVVIYTAYR